MHYFLSKIKYFMYQQDIIIQVNKYIVKDHTKNTYEIFCSS